MPIVLGSERSPYGDTPDPKCFGTVSPLDPQLFSTIVEHVQDLLAGRTNPKYSPIEVAQWIEDFIAASDDALAKARTEAVSTTSPEFRRIEEDVLIQNGLGAFFAAKLRSGALYEIYQQTGDANAGKLAVEQYTWARERWAKMAERASRVYAADVSYGDVPMRRGHWGDRLSGIDTDLAAMQQKLQSPPAFAALTQTAAEATRAVTGRPSRPSIQCVHTPPESFHPGEPLMVSLQIFAAAQAAPAAVRLYYRHVNQAERWRSADMEGGQGSYSAAIPAGYTQSPYPLQYYFAPARENEPAWRYPEFNPTLSNQPYYAIAKRAVQKGT
jgi:hypothetical protein